VEAASEAGASASPRRWSLVDKAFWSVCIAAGGAILTACAIPAIEIGQGGYVGAGSSQQAFDFDRTITLFTYPRPGTLLYLLAAVLLILAGVAGLVRGGSVVLAAIACAVVVAALAHNAYTIDRIRGWDGGSGVTSCTGSRGDESLSQCAGGYLYPAIRDLDRDILRSTVGQRPGFHLLSTTGYRARALGGWYLLTAVLWVLTPLVLFRLLRYRMGVAASAAASVGLMLLAVGLWFVVSFPSE
jgi:hypothetical protein